MDSESNPFSESLVASNMRDSRDWSPLGYPTNITRDITDLVNGMSHQAHNGILLGPPKGMTRFNRSPGFRLFFSQILEEFSGKISINQGPSEEKGDCLYLPAHLLHYVRSWRHGGEVCWDGWSWRHWKMLIGLMSSASLIIWLVVLEHVFSIIYGRILPID